RHVGRRLCPRAGANVANPWRRTRWRTMRVPGDNAAPPARAGSLGIPPMSEYTATVSWRRLGAVFTDNKYSRAHEWRFDGGVVVPASSSPHVVRVPLSDPGAVDPE